MAFQEIDGMSEGVEKKAQVLLVEDNLTDATLIRTILEKVKGGEARIESVINEILSEGICYEPTPGKIKRI